MKELMSPFLRENGELTTLGKLVFALLIFLFTKLIILASSKMLDKLIERKFTSAFQKNRSRTITVAKLLNSAIKYILLFFALLEILNIFGINTSSIIATAGIGGVAIALGAQSFFKDIIRGMTIFFEDAMSVGDFVNLANVTGTVIELGIRKTILQDYDGSMYLIPNGEISTIRNYSRNNMRAEIKIPVSYEADLERVKKIIESLADDLKEDEDFVVLPYYLGLDELNDFSFLITVTSMVKSGKNYLAKRKLNEMVYKKFREEELGFSKFS